MALKRNTSKHRGVSLYKLKKMWVASFRHTTVGYFKNEEDAHEAYLKAKAEYEKNKVPVIKFKKPKPPRKPALPRKHSSKYTGVRWDTRCNKWIPSFRKTYLGLFVNEEDANQAYLKAKTEYEKNNKKDLH